MQILGQTQDSIKLFKGIHGNLYYRESFFFKWVFKITDPCLKYRFYCMIYKTGLLLITLNSTFHNAFILCNRSETFHLLSKLTLLIRYRTQYICLRMTLICLFEESRIVSVKNNSLTFQYWINRSHRDNFQNSTCQTIKCPIYIDPNQVIGRFQI